MPVVGATYQQGAKPSVRVSLRFALLGPASSSARLAIVPRPVCVLQVKTAVPQVSSPLFPKLACGP
ncbi:MAG: hypothetical protein BWZ02_03360 [Lentisphaerae bacterium ADurb.BinA184]|nr:MAG: hypothetical protein BWZ02_03360 [Lentisphaerae bacterium ADurb.BinA184]